MVVWNNMNAKKREYEFVTVGNKTFQFKDGKLKWVIDWIWSEKVVQHD